MMNELNFKEKSMPIVMGHLLIKDATTGDVLIDKRNAIHYENMSIAIVKALAQQQEGHIFEMAFGNGGAVVNGIGSIDYQRPNVVGQSAQLYNETYRKEISETDIEVRHTAGDLYTDMIIMVTLGFGEPIGQSAFDDTTNMNDDYVFNEIALKSFDGNQLTHVIFSPTQKSLNRIIEIYYTIRISMC